MLVGLPWEVNSEDPAYIAYSGYNPYQFASPELAQQMAEATGSQVVMTNVLGPIQPPSQALLDFGTERLNAGLVAQQYAMYDPVMADAVIRAMLAHSGTEYQGIELPKTEAMEITKKMATDLNTTAGTTTAANAAGVSQQNQITTAALPANIDSLMSKLQEESPVFGLQWWMVIGAVAAGFWYLEKKG